MQGNRDALSDINPDGTFWDSGQVMGVHTVYVLFFPFVLANENEHCTNILYSVRVTQRIAELFSQTFGTVN